jgi:hypothetical protein
VSSITESAGGETTEVIGIGLQFCSSSSSPQKSFRLANTKKEIATGTELAKKKQPAKARATNLNPLQASEDLGPYPRRQNTEFEEPTPSVVTDQGPERSDEESILEARSKVCWGIIVCDGFKLETRSRCCHGGTFNSNQSLSLHLRM